MLSRMKEYIGNTFKNPDGSLKQGSDYKLKRNVKIKGTVYPSIGILTRWKDGRLNDDGDLPAVEWSDAHIEYFQNGQLHNERTNAIGERQPAIIDDYGANQEYYQHGRQIFLS